VWRSEKVTAIFTNDDEEIDLSFLLRAGGGTERKAVSSKEEVREGRLDGLYGRPKNKKNPRLEILGYGYYFAHLVEDSKWTFMESSIFKKKKKQCAFLCSPCVISFLDWMRQKYYKYKYIKLNKFVFGKILE